MNTCSLRSQILEGTVETVESENEGCITLHSPVSLAEVRLPRMIDSTVPVLHWLDMLDQAGFVPTAAAAATHRPGSDLVYDARGAGARRRYFQCLLHRDGRDRRGGIGPDETSATRDCRCANASGVERDSRGEVVRLAPHERVQQQTAEQIEEVPQFLEETVEVKLVSQERVQQRRVEHAPVPQVLEEIVEVVLAPTKRVRQQTVEHVPVPQILKDNRGGQGGATRMSATTDHRACASAPPRWCGWRSATRLLS